MKSTERTRPARSRRRAGAVRPRSAKTPAARELPRYTIATARAQLPRLVNQVVTRGAVSIGVRGSRQAVLISHDQYQKLNAAPPRQVARFIAHKFLGNAPSHLIEPQIEELASLPIGDLIALSSIDLPLRASDRAVLSKRLRDSDVLDRLEKRVRIARDIRKAVDEGLYDLEEHNTSRLDLWGSEDSR